MTHQQELLAMTLAFAVDDGLERVELWRLWLPRIEQTLLKRGLVLSVVENRVIEEDPFA